MYDASSTKSVYRFVKSLNRDKLLWVMLLPGLIWYAVFLYAPMYGLVIAFKDFSPFKGILASKWVGLRWFNQFYNSQFFWQLIRNTLLLNIYNLIFGFPLPIVLAVMVTEVRNKYYKKITQTITYLPYFISQVIAVGILVNLFNMSGVVNQAVRFFGGEPINFMARPEWFRTLYVGSGIWQYTGWNSIIFIAALTGVDPELYEAAVVDGASKIKQIVHISIPTILPTIIIMLILNLGRILSVGYEKIIIMYNPMTYETADVINSYVYRRGIASGEFSFGTAVGLFQSVVNCIFIFIANYTSRKISDISLW